MVYEDFRVTITAKVKGGNRVLIDSPAGSYAGTFKNPIDKSNLDEILIKSGLKARSKKSLRGIKSVKKTDDLDRIGNKISKALFKENVLTAYAQSQLIATGRGNGLRIKIRIDPYIEEYARLMSLPWEFLYDATQRGRIELMDDRAVIRDQITPEPVTPLEVESPLRVLAVISNPVNYPSLKLGREKEFLKGMSGKIRNIDVKFLKKATIQELYNEMRSAEKKKQPYHILHFMGHGGIYRNKGVLIFKDKNDKGVRVTGEMLRLALTNSVRLVFLNACETGRIPQGDPFAAIPTELLHRGVPAVLSMQFPISDDAAITFGKHFYEHLVKGYPVDQCIGNGRRQIRFNDDISAEWGTPVLFMRSPDGILFEMGQAPTG